MWAVRRWHTGDRAATNVASYVLTDTMGRESETVSSLQFWEPEPAESRRAPVGWISPEVATPIPHESGGRRTHLRYIWITRPR